MLLKLLNRIHPVTYIILALVMFGLTMGLLIAIFLLRIGAYNG